jgi:hypothetical protein
MIGCVVVRATLSRSLCKYLQTKKTLDRCKIISKKMAIKSKQKKNGKCLWETNNISTQSLLLVKGVWFCKCLTFSTTSSNWIFSLISWGSDEE